MPDHSTLTVRLPQETTSKLQRLAGHTQRTQSALASEAVAGYVDRELAIIEAIECGREEVRAGRGLYTDDVFREVEAAIAAAEAGRAER